MRTDRFLVIDVEATCWKSPPPKGMASEIIEVGVCSVEKKEIVDKLSIIVKPDRSTISEFCTELTGISDDTIKTFGIKYKSAMHILMERFGSARKMWMSWGDYDRHMFKNRGPYPFGKERHVNAKTLFALQLGLKTGPGVINALKLLDMEFEGRHHSGADDAYNIARIILKMWE